MSVYSPKVAGVMVVPIRIAYMGTLIDLLSLWLFPGLGRRSHRVALGSHRYRIAVGTHIIKNGRRLRSPGATKG